jgi:hypothetical protein
VTNAIEKPRDLYRWIPWVLVPAVFIIYASHPTRKFYFDGVVFASIIEHGPYEALFNPHHLLYTWLFSEIHNIFEKIAGTDIKALYIMQWANIALGSIGVGLIWKLVYKLVRDKGLALLVVLLGCFSFTYWHYSTDADVYIISTVFLLIAADRLVNITCGDHPENRTPVLNDFVFIGFFQALSVLFHQLNIFWTASVIGCLVFGTISGTRKERWKFWWIYLASLAIPVALAYSGIGIFVLKHNDPNSFMFWITEYGHESKYWISSWKEIPLGTMNGYLMVFFHRLSITPDILEYDLGLAMEQGRIFKGLLKKVFGYYALGFLFFMYLASLYNVKKYYMQFPKRAVLVFSWLAPYVIFQFFFMPTNYFYKIFMFVPLLTVFAWYGQISISSENRWLKWSLFALFVIFTSTQEPILAILVTIFILVFEFLTHRKNEIYRQGLIILMVFLGLYNYIAGIAPESRLKNNPEVMQAIQLEPYFKDGDLLIFDGGYDYPDGWIISALTRAKVISLEEFFETPQAERDGLIGDCEDLGGNVYLHPNINAESAQVNESATELGVPAEELMSVVGRYSRSDGFVLNGQEFEVLHVPGNSGGNE